MELINNRYRILKNIKQHRLVSTYLVTDILNSHEIIKLNILSSEYFPETLFEYLSKEFYNISNIECKGVSKVFDFGIINSIDNKRIESGQYYITSENIDQFYKANDAALQMNEEEMLLLFIDILQNVNYFHLKGFIYGGININNIFICRNNTTRAIFKDLATLQYENYCYWSSKNDELNFKAPEVLAGKEQTVTSDIYSLGILMMTLLLDKSFDYISIYKEFDRIKNLIMLSEKFSKRFKETFLKVIEKMINIDPALRYKNIHEIVLDINSGLGTSFKSHRQEEIEKLNLNTVLIGREFETKSILNIYDSMMRGESNKKFVLIHGEYGIGKTKMLKELERLFILKGINVYSSFSLDNSVISKEKTLQEIINKFIFDSDTENARKFEQGIMENIREIGTPNNILYSDDISEDKGKIRDLNSIYNLMTDCIKNKPAILMIDNLHLGSDFLIDLFELIYLRGKNIVVIFSYCDGEYSYNKRFSSFVTKLIKSHNAVEILLRGLNREDTSSFVEKTLGMPSTPVKFSSRIYSKTYGNPLFIQETIKDFFSQKIIYVDENRGVWNSEYDDYYDRLPIPSNMQQAVLNQIKGIDELGYEILRSVSIINSAISVEGISHISERDIQPINTALEDLESKGILCKKIEDRGFVFDFCNRVLKNLISSGLEEGDKITKHKLAADFLEIQYNEGVENGAEFIYHLEESKQKDKVILYCKENAKRMEAYKNRKEVRRYLKKAAAMYEDDVIDEERIRLLIKIADTYEEDSNGNSAIKYYERAERLASKALNYKLQIDCLNKIANIYFKKFDIEKITKLINKIGKILKKFEGDTSECCEEYLQFRLTQSGVSILKQDYDEARNICLESIKLCDEKNHKLRGLFYRQLGNIHLDSGCFEEALVSYGESIREFKIINYVEGIIGALNNIGVVYCDYIQDDEKSVHYFNKAKNISEENHLISYELLGLTNIACIYYNKLEYELSLQCFQEVIKKSQDMEYESDIFCFNYLTSIYLKLCNNKEAYNYFLQAQKELEMYPEHGKEIAVYYQSAAELFFAFGELEKSKEFINKALELYKNDDSIQKNDCEMIYEKIKIYSNEQEKYEGVSDIESAVDKCKKDINKVYYLCDIAVALYLNGFSYEAEKLFRKIKKIEIKDKPDIVRINELFLQAVLGKKGSGLEQLNLALELSKKHKNKIFHCNICVAIGDYYFAKRNFFHAVNYYFEGCEIAKDLIMSVPEEFRIKYFKVNGLNKPFNKLSALKKFKEYNYSLDYKDDTLYPEDNNELERLLSYDFFKDILKNKYFIKSAKRIHSTNLPKGIRELKDVIKNLNSDAQKSLELIAKFLAGATLATRSMIISTNSEQNYIILASNNEEIQNHPNKYVIERVRATREPILINESWVRNEGTELKLLPEDVKALICIPIIISEDQESEFIREERRRNTYRDSEIKGYIYLESERMLNSFNEDGMERCMEFAKLAGFIIDKYRLQVISYIDKLTGVFTRKHLEDMLRYHLDRAEELNTVFSVIMFDMDFFKQINDRFGHRRGDEVLKKACLIARNAIRKNDVIGRYGGEEFIIILPDVDTKDAFIVAEKIRREIESQKILGDKISVTVSMGISTYPSHGQWIEELIEKADQALYVSKENGRNRCETWNKSFSVRAKGTNKLTGIISGNIVQDSRNVLAMMDIIELIKMDISKSDKIYRLLGRIIETTESEYGTIFVFENEKISNKYSRRMFEESWVEPNWYNTDIINSVIESKQGVYLIDWDENTSHDVLTGMPKWHSIAVTPILKNSKVEGVLYLAVPTSLKEFKADDFNFINTLGEIAAAIL